MLQEEKKRIRGKLCEVYRMTDKDISNYSDATREYWKKREENWEKAIKNPINLGVISYDKSMPQGRTYCNDKCTKYKSPKPNNGKNPYATHVTCKKCDGIWMLKTSCKIGKNGQLRCPCCNILVRTTARRKYGGDTAKIYQ